MYQHNIQLKVSDVLNYDQASAWYNTVRKFGPEGNTLTYQHNGEQVSMEYGECADCEFSHVYIVPLKRDLTLQEAQFIINAWEYQYDEDFDIEISNTYHVMSDVAGDIDLELEEDVRVNAVSDLNKWRHNRWVDAKIGEGWRYGAYFNSQQKTHPALRSWDDLPESHRRSTQVSDSEIFEWLLSNKII
jgi:hypothetical protein